MRAAAVAIVIAIVALVVLARGDATLRGMVRGRAPVAQIPTVVPAPSLDEPGPVLVVGGVVRDIYGNAVATAIVTWRDGDASAECTTSTTGAFSLPPAATRGVLEARADGYAPAVHAAGRDVEIVLVPEATIRGRVVAGTTPLANVLVRARGQSFAGWGFAPITHAEVHTDADGTFILAGVSPGHWQLALDEPRWFAAPVETDAHAAALAEVTIVASTGTRVAGRIVSDAPCPSPHVWLTSAKVALHARDLLVFSAVPPGTYDVTAACGDEPAIALAPLVVTTHPLGDISWELARAALHGRVIDERGRVVTSATIAVAPDLPDAVTDENGRFTITGRTGTYVLTVVTADRRARGAEIEVALAPAAREVTLVVRTGHTLRGRIDVPRAGVELHALATATDGVIAETTIEADGTFAFEDLTTGPHQIAICDPWAGEIGAGRAQPGDAVTIATVAFTQVLDGCVADAMGQPLTDGMVSAASTADTACSLAHDGRPGVPLDDHGRFRLPPLPTGHYEVLATSLDKTEGAHVVDCAVSYR